MVPMLKLVTGKRQPKRSLREHIVAEFAAMRSRLDEAEKRILASLDTPTEAA